MQSEETRTHADFMRRAIELSRYSMESLSGGPFGAVIVHGGTIVGEGYNQVTVNNDPTAHGEIVAIRNACKHLGTFELSECELYTSCEPCPMCLGAIYWSRIRGIYYACTQADAEAVGFDDAFIYREFNLPHAERGTPTIQLMRDEGRGVLEDWKTWPGRVPY